MSHPDEHRRWARQRRYAARALRDLRRRELRNLTDEQARQAIADVLDLLRDIPEGEPTSGLVEQQRVLHSRHG